MKSMIKRADEFCIKLFSNKWISGGLVLLTLAACAVYFCMGSVLHPWSVKLPSLDSTVWLRCGVGMLRGDTMYVDLWDHKGPFLFVIHYLGLSLTPHSLTGLWILECIFLFLALLGLFYTAQLVSENKLVSVVAVLGTMHGLYYYFDDGDIVEEWALPLIAFSLYFFVRYLKTGELKKWQIVLAGCFGALAFLLNGNLISVWIAFVPIIGLRLVLKKQWRALGQCCICFLSGLLGVFLVFAVVLTAQGAIRPFLEAYFGFNQGYIAGNSLYQCYSAVIASFYKDPWFGYAHIGCLIALLHQKKWDQIFYVFFYSGVTLLMLNMSGRQYSHYGMQLVPCMILPTAVVTGMLYRWCRTNREFLVVLALLFVVWVRFDVGDYSTKIRNTMNTEDRNDYAGGDLDNYLIVNEWLNGRWTDEQIEEWVINDSY